MSSDDEAQGVMAATGGSPRRRRLRADAAKNRETLLRAAEVVMSERGLGARISDIAAEAGLGEGTVLRHFHTKANLVTTIAEVVTNRFVQDLQIIADSGDPDGFHAALRSMVEKGVEQKAFLDLLTHEGSGAPTIAEGALAQLQSTLTALLEHAQRHHRIRDDLPPSEALLLATTICSTAINRGWKPDTRKRLISVILDGLAPKAVHVVANKDRP